MKLNSLNRIGLPLALGLGFCAIAAQAAPTAQTTVSPYRALAAKLQGSSTDAGDKSVSEKFAPSPQITALAGTRSRIAGLSAAPKRLFIDPLTTLPPAPKNRAPMALRKLGLRIDKTTAQTDSHKNIGEISATLK
jgi:hypothetical protein